MKKLVFVVEDDRVQQKLLHLHFEAMSGGYEVLLFTNPEVMMAELGRRPFVVLLDHFFDSLPERTGLDYLRDMRRRFPRLPIIYFTNSTDPDVHREAMKLGANYFIGKDPASLVRLRTALDTISQEPKRWDLLGALFN